MDRYYWILSFFIYSIYGWIWESSLVSIEKKKLTKRGFLKGPVIPIYGSGAILILITTQNMRNNILLTAVTASLAVTVMELFTGLAMEELFHVRYWDYTRFRFNFKGYISLVSSSVWAVFSLLLIYVIDRPVNRFLQTVPENIKIALVSVLFPIFLIDVILSVREAIQLRKVIDSVISDIHELGDRVEESVSELKEKMESRREYQRELITELLDNYELKKSLILKELEDNITENMNSEDLKKYETFRASLSDFRKASEEKRKMRIEIAKNRWTSYRNAISRNSRIRSVRLENELKNLASRIDKKKKD